MSEFSGSEVQFAQPPKLKACPRPPGTETYANSRATIEYHQISCCQPGRGMEDGLCVSVIDTSLDKSMPLINKKISPSHCQKNIITVYRLCSFPFHIRYVHKAWCDTATVKFPKSSLSNLSAPPDRRYRTCQNVLLAFPVPVFISRPLLPSAVLHFLQ